MNWTEALERTLAGRGDKIPKGWMSGEQVGKQWNLGQARRNELLAVMIKSGTAERRIFRIFDGGKLRMVPFYRVQVRR